MSSILKILPKSYLSFCVGKLAGIRAPRWVLDPILDWFIKTYGVKTEESARPVSSFSSVAEFFLRDLKDGARTIKGDLVSPVDGTFRSSGVIRDGKIEDVKGINYKVQEFFKSHEYYRSFEKGTFFNFYLAPGDYHHVHSPIKGTVTDVIYIPGKLWPVNDWSLSNVRDLFVENERMIVILQTDKGKVAVALVGATNVGKITLSFDSFFVGNQLTPGRFRPYFHKKYSTPIPLDIGQRLGSFNLGSTVILFFEWFHDSLEQSKQRGQKIYLGDPLP